MLEQGNAHRSNFGTEKAHLDDAIPIWNEHRGNHWNVPVSDRYDC